TALERAIGGSTDLINTRFQPGGRGPGGPSSGTVSTVFRQSFWSESSPHSSGQAIGGATDLINTRFQPGGQMARGASSSGSVSTVFAPPGDLPSPVAP